MHAGKEIRINDIAAARRFDQCVFVGRRRIGLTGDADSNLKDALGPPRVALVLGAEGAGMRPNTREHCDALARLPISDAIESLNVSNAAAIAAYEWKRRRTS